MRATLGAQASCLLLFGIGEVYLLKKVRAGDGRAIYNSSILINL